MATKDRIEELRSRVVVVAALVHASAVLVAGLSPTESAEHLQALMFGADDAVQKVFEMVNTLLASA